MGFLDGRERRFGLGNKKPPLPLGEGSKGLLLLACVLIGLLSSVAFAAEPSRDERFLAGLRERGLHELAETYCRDRLTQPDLSPRDRAELTIQWTRTLAQHAVNAPPEARGPVWRQAQQVVDDFLRRHPQNPRRRLVRLQGALAHLARGELGRQESEIVPNGQPTLDEARSELHAAIRELEALADEVDAALRASATRPDERTDRLTADELASLGKNVQYQLARARRNQGLCFAAASADRTNSLTRAVELLAPLTKLDSADPLAWKSRVDQIVCYRLLADHAAASRMLEALTARKPPSAIGLRAQAERIRLALDAGRLAEALAMLELPRRLEGITSPQLDYARLEACLAGWRAASQSGNNAGAQRWQTLAGKMLRQIETEHGLYWTRRGEMLLAGVFQTAVESGDLETLVRAAKSFYLSGRLDDALAGYDRAATMAAEQGSDARALELAYVAAMIQQKRGRHRDAMTRCRRAAMAMPRADKASETHLQAIRNAAEVAKSKAAGSLDRYAQMLEEHLQTWPGSTTANQARWWLGRLRQHRRDWPRAIEAYSRISADDANRPAAVAAVAQCYQAWIGARRASDQSTAELATQGAGWFESVIVAPEGGLPSRWSPLAREAALHAARLWLEHAPDGYTRAQRILSAALAGAVDAPPEWTSSARALLVASLAGQGHTRAAEATLEGVSAAGAESLLEMLDGLRRVAVDAKPAIRSELARLQLRAVDMLATRWNQLDEPEQRALELIHAQALADAGRVDEALRRFSLLSTKYPRDGRIQEAHAGLLSSRSDRASLENALAKWRELEKHSKPGNAAWFRAKYAVAELHCRLGNPERTAKIITLLEVLRPELGGPKMKAQFQKLRQRCGKAD